MIDAFDLTDVTIHNSPDVRGWPITSEIQHIALGPTQLVLQHTKINDWPAVPFEHAQQVATLWIFLRLDGHWHGAGVERLRPGQTMKLEGPPSSYRDNWYNDLGRWGEMAAHQPVPGELVGFLVAAGDTRGFGAHPVEERSAVVLVRFPPDTGDVYPPWAAHGGLHNDVPASTPAPDPSQPDALAAFVTAIDRLVSAINENVTAVTTLSAKIDAIRQSGLRVHL